jgi:hypothetical protein
MAWLPEGQSRRLTGYWKFSVLLERAATSVKKNRIAGKAEQDVAETPHQVCQRRRDGMHQLRKSRSGELAIQLRYFPRVG